MTSLKREKSGNMLSLPALREGGPEEEVGSAERSLVEEGDSTVFGCPCSVSPISDSGSSV